VGSPEEIAAVQGSYTGRFLSELVRPSKSGKAAKLPVAA
jgi:hypothetical protein